MAIGDRRNAGVRSCRSLEFPVADWNRLASVTGHARWEYCSPLSARLFAHRTVGGIADCIFVRKGRKESQYMQS